MNLVNTAVACVDLGQFSVLQIVEAFTDEVGWWGLYLQSSSVCKSVVFDCCKVGEKKCQRRKSLPSIVIHLLSLARWLSDLWVWKKMFSMASKTAGDERCLSVNPPHPFLSLSCHPPTPPQPLPPKNHLFPLYPAQLKVLFEKWVCVVLLWKCVCVLHVKFVQ